MRPPHSLVWPPRCIIFSLKTGRFCPMTSLSWAHIHGPPDKSGSSLILRKKPSRTSSRWENKWKTVNRTDYLGIKPATRCSFVLQFFRQSASKGSFLWAAIENLQKGVSWHRTKPFLIVEVRYFQATILGLPLEISKYYETINGISVNGEWVKSDCTRHRSPHICVYRSLKECMSFHIFLTQPQPRSIPHWLNVLDNCLRLTFRWRLTVSLGKILTVDLISTSSAIDTNYVVLPPLNQPLVF